MKLIVGIGNPGKEYVNTRHNVGYYILDNYLDDLVWQKKRDCLLIEQKVHGEKTIFIKPTTYVNNSGNIVEKYQEYYKITIQDILVIRDDLDLELGQMRVKKNSSSGGHNGIKSIITCLGSKDFYQLKIGISNSKNVDTKDYVLGKLSFLEKDTINKLIPLTKNIIDDFICDKGEKIIKKY